MQFSNSITRMRRALSARTLVIGSAILTVNAAHAADVSWVVPTGDYNVGANWSTGVAPSEGDNAVINNGGVSTLSMAGFYSLDGLFVGKGTGLSGTFNSSTGYISLIGPDDPAPQDPGVWIGADGGTGVMNLSGDAYIEKRIRTNDTRIGFTDATIGGGPSTGTLNVKGTSTYYSYWGTLEAGRGLGSVGTINISETGTIRTDYLNAIGQVNGTGFLNISGNGTLRAEGGSIRVVGDAGVGGTDATLPTTGTAVISGNGKWIKGDSNNVEMWIGQQRGGVGNMTLNNNALVEFDGWQVVGRGPSTGTVVMNNDSIWRKRNTDGGRDGNFIIADGGPDTGGQQAVASLSHGTLTLNNNSFVDVDNETWVGQFYGTGTLVMNDASRFQSDNWFAVGRESAIGSVTMNGTSSLTHGPDGNIVIGSLGGAGTMTMNGNSKVVTSAELWMNERGGPNGGTDATSVLTMNDASTFDTAGTNTNLGFNGGGSTTIILNGTSRLTTGRIFRRADYTGTRSLVFNGGGLRATRAQTDYIQLTESEITIQAGGATIDSNGFAISILPTLTGVGGLTKAGAGTLTVNKLNLGGTVTATGGTLALAAPATPFAVANASKVGSLADGAGVIDLADNYVVVEFTGAAPAASVRGAIAGGGVISGVLPSTQGIGFALASTVADALQISLAADDTSYIMRRTRNGDANLTLDVNFDDLLLLAQNYNGTNKIWGEGDFTYDGLVNFDDLLVLAQNYNQSLSLNEQSLVGGDIASDWTLARSLVPEPTAIVGGAGLVIAGFRRRRSA